MTAEQYFDLLKEAVHGGPVTVIALMGTVILMFVKKDLNKHVAKSCEMADRAVSAVESLHEITLRHHHTIKHEGPFDIAVDGPIEVIMRHEEGHEYDQKNVASYYRTPIFDRE